MLMKSWYQGIIRAWFPPHLSSCVTVEAVSLVLCEGHKMGKLSSQKEKPKGILLKSEENVCKRDSFVVTCSYFIYFISLITVRSSWVQI